VATARAAACALFGTALKFDLRKFPIRKFSQQVNTQVTDQQSFHIDPAHGGRTRKFG
jgi:hypothetical protein